MRKHAANIESYYNVNKCRVPTPYPKWNSLPFPWLYDQYSLPILHEIVWNLFTYDQYFKILDTRGYDQYSLPILQEIVWNLFTCDQYFKILDTRGYSFLTIWFCLWPNIIFIVLMNWVFQHLWKHKIPHLLTHFPTLPDFVSQFPTFSWP